MSQILNLRLKNYTAFEDLDQDFSKGINILIGANGTGKTHILKILYSACAITNGEDKERAVGAKLRGVFNPYQGRIGRLVRRKNKSASTSVSVRRKGGARLLFSFSNHAQASDDIKVIGRRAWAEDEIESAYIPVKEMLAHAPGFLALAAKREVAFEEVYIDLLKRAFLPKLKGPTDQKRKKLLDELQKAIEGKVFAKGEHFFLKSKQGDLEFSLLAEGVRKLALVWLLIQNGTLLSGSVLFWDEPEANLNPSLMGQVVEIILELQRLGVQVFLTTHNYVLLKEFDLRKKPADAIRYISLFRQRGGPVLSRAADEYSSIDPNVISDTMNRLYDEELKRDFADILG